MDQRQLFW